MRNNIYILMTLCTLLFVGCDKLEDELFVKKVIFTNNGFYSKEVAFVESNIVTIDLPISISGTSTNNKDVSVTYSLDEESLTAYNVERFRDSEALYYQLLPSDSYTLLDPNPVVVAGDDYTVISIEVDLSKVDKFAQFVLPLALDSTSEYVLDDEYSSVLLHISFSNEYSGSYSILTGTLIEDGQTSGLSLASTTKTLYAMAYDQCYFYAGNIDDDDEERDDYIVYVTFNTDGTLSLEGQSEAIALTSTASDIENSINCYELTYTAIENTLNELIMSKLYLDYSYTYTNSTTGVVYRYNMTGGSILMTKTK